MSNDANPTNPPRSSPGEAFYATVDQIAGDRFAFKKSDKFYAADGKALEARRATKGTLLEAIALLDRVQGEELTIENIGRVGGLLMLAAGQWKPMIEMIAEGRLPNS